MDLLTDCLEPILSFLKEQLPPPVYSFIISMLSHCLAFCTAFYTLVGGLASTNPLQWNAQTVLPPSHCCILSIFRPAESLSDYKLDVAHQLLVYQVGVLLWPPLLGPQGGCLVTNNYRSTEVEVGLALERWRWIC